MLIGYAYVNRMLSGKTDDSAAESCGASCDAADKAVRPAHDL